MINMDFKASTFDYPVTNPCEWVKVTGTNGEIIVLAFDDTTEEDAQLDIKMPGNLDTSGSLIVELEGFAATADGNEVKFALKHSAKNAGENWDAAYSQADGADKVTDGVQDQLDYISWVVSIASLGWVANDGIRIMLSRVAIDDGSKVVGDYYVRHLRLRIPTL